MSTNYLKTFTAGEKIKASDTNSNNQYLNDKIDDSASTLTQYVDSKAASLSSSITTLSSTVTSNKSSVDSSISSLNSSISSLQTTVNNKNDAPNYSGGWGIGFPYTVPQNGWVLSYLENWNVNGGAYVYVNGYIANSCLGGSSGGIPDRGSSMVRVSTGDYLSYNGSVSTVNAWFFPLKG